MSAQEAKRLVDDAQANDGLWAQLLEKGVEEAHRLGYDVTAEEVEAEIAERRSAQSDQPERLLVEELDKVAGGAYWLGEDASDEHELGCFIFYHSESWSEEHDEYCKRSYICAGNYWCSRNFHFVEEID